MSQVTLQEYTRFAINQTDQKYEVRIILYPESDLASQILAFHTERGANIVRIHECISSVGNLRLPMPNEVFAEVRNRTIIENSQSLYVVVGLDGYLSLLDNENVKLVIKELHQLADVKKSNVLIMLSAVWAKILNEYFNNPKYDEAWKIIKLKGVQEIINWPEVLLVSKDWATKTNINIFGFAKLLEILGDFTVNLNDKIVVGLSCYISVQAGLNHCLQQIVSISEFMREFYNVDTPLPDKTLEFIFSKIKEDNLTVLDAIKRDFGANNDLLRNAPKLLTECNDETRWSAYIWMLQRSIPMDSYLHHVIELPNLSKDNFLQCYVVEAVVDCMDSNYNNRMAEERRNALREIGSAQSLLGDFIDKVMNLSNEKVIPWLNNGSEQEYTEMIRRVGLADLSAGLPKNIADLYPGLRDYLSDYQYGSPDLNDYFATYRKFKIQGFLTPAFCEKAFELKLPGSIKSRNSILKQFENDIDNALLLVDGMGAEYLPLLISLAKRFNINIHFHTIAYVKLPTSTEFNPISWEQSRCLTEVKTVDNIAHNGISAHEFSPFEKNFMGVLNAFEKQVFNAIILGLKKFKRVVVTADHGASRLAVLAYKNGFSKTLEINENVLDWRYAKSNTDESRPVELEGTLDGYWVVRGYNRLPKQGGKFNELHGGATLEERLVPVVVFTTESGAAIPIKPIEKPSAQIVEKDDFDI